jgi:hypothetical protein
MPEKSLEINPKTRDGDERGDGCGMNGRGAEAALQRRTGLE